MMGEVALELIAKNPDCLHQVHQPLLLDCWKTPEQEEQFSVGLNKKTLFDLCLFEIEKSERARRDFHNKDRTDQVIAILKSVKASQTEGQRNRIERILKRIESTRAE